MKGDFHAPFRGSPGVKFPRATRLFLTKSVIGAHRIARWVDHIGCHPAPLARRHGMA